MSFEAFIGIDQTGAALQNGKRAKPLHTAVLKKSGSRWRLNLHQISALNEERLCLILPRLKQCALLVDCVFGLPKTVWRTQSTHFWEEIESSWKKDLAQALYGRIPAEKFFERILKGKRDYPRRECETLAKANSVFRSRPFQKNIQTGTFRIWKDLAQSPRWFQLWPFDARTESEEKPWLFEAFPSLLWKKVLGLNTRDRTQLKEAVLRTFGKRIEISTRDWHLIRNNADTADAAVLSLSGLFLHERDELFAPFKEFSPPSHEGWIAGLCLDQNT